MANDQVFDLKALQDSLNVPSTQPSVTGARAAGGIEGLVVLFNSTEGKITVSAELAQIINVQDGDPIVFHDNLEVVNKAISQNLPPYIQFAKASGLDPKLPTTANEFRNAVIQYYVGKGYQRIGNDGKPVFKAAPVSEQAIKEFFNENKESLYAKYRNDIVDDAGNVTTAGIVSQVRDQYVQKGFSFPDVEAAIAAGATQDEIQALNDEIDELCLPHFTFKVIDRSDLPTTETPVFVGCRAAANGSAKGWKQVAISDMTMWKRVKGDLGDIDNMKTVNRLFKASATAYTINVQNGSETIEQLLFPISFWKDETPAIAPNKGGKVGAKV